MIVKYDPATPLSLDTLGLSIYAELHNMPSNQTIPLELPIVVMIHGFPQSSEMWKYVIDRLPSNIPIYVPDIPGYGRSTLTVLRDYSKREIGTVILDSLHHRLKQYQGKSSNRQKIILVGHDRGARIAHRLSVDNNHPHFEIIGAALLDIVPTLVQLESFSNPAIATGYFHWSLLSSPPPLAADMLWAYGGAKWVEYTMGVQATEEGQKRVQANMPYYKKYFSDRKTIDAACADYRAAATVDCEEQRRDQSKGRKLKVPILTMYSGEFIGVHFDFSGVWKEWVDDEKLLRAKKMADGIGHYLAEEDPDTVTNTLLEWFRDVLNVRV